MKSSLNVARIQPGQQWKAPVKEWIRDFYEKREGKMAARAVKKKKSGQATGKTEVAKEDVESASSGDETKRTVDFSDDPF